MKDKQAKIYKSIWGNTWCVEECIGCTLYYNHFDTYEEAINYSEKNELEIIDKPKPKYKTMEKAIEILKDEFKKCIHFYKYYMQFVNDVNLNHKYVDDAEKVANIWQQRAQQTDYLIYLLEKENGKDL